MQLFADMKNNFFLKDIDTLTPLKKSSKQYFTPFLNMQMHFCKTKILHSKFRTRCNAGSITFFTKIRYLWIILLHRVQRFFLTKNFSNWILHQLTISHFIMSHYIWTTVYGCALCVVSRPSEIAMKMVKTILRLTAIIRFVISCDDNILGSDRHQSTK